MHLPMLFTSQHRHRQSHRCSMTDLNFVTDGTLLRVLRRRTQQEHHQDILRSCLKHKLKHIANDTERAVDYCRGLIRAGGDATDELKELECAGNGLLLVA